MCAALEACQELKHDEPDNHNHNRGQTDHIEPLCLLTDAEDPAVEAQDAELDASQRRRAQDIPRDLKLS